MISLQQLFFSRCLDLHTRWGNRLRHHESHRNIWDSANHLDRSCEDKACTVVSGSICQVATDPSTSTISSRLEWRDCLAGFMETINNHKIAEQILELKVFEIAWNGFNCVSNINLYNSIWIHIIYIIYTIYLSKSVDDSWYLLAEKLGRPGFPFLVDSSTANK